MNHATDGNLAAIESHLNERDEDDCCDGQHRKMEQWESMTDEERAECLWHHPEAIPDSVGG
jgi:predicted Fe-S protein YdhL (DUF1289 family)